MLTCFIKRDPEGQKGEDYAQSDTNRLLGRMPQGLTQGLQHSHRGVVGAQVVSMMVTLTDNKSRKQARVKNVLA